MRIALLLLLCSCQIDHKIKNIPTNYEAKIEGDIEVSPPFDKVYEYCVGKVDHDIKTELLDDPQFALSEEDKEYAVNDCYYSFDFSYTEEISDEL
jgi:hypothetical protein